jgi:hypothetical protein
MPQYATSGSGSLALNPVLPAVLWPGDQVYLWGATNTNPGFGAADAGAPPPGQIAAPNDGNVNFEDVVTGARSIAVQLASRPGGGAAPGCMVQVIANGNPGAAEVDIQDAAIDADGAYLTNTSSTIYKLTTWTQIGSSNFWTAWSQFQPEGAGFITLKLIANPNGVEYTAKLVYV